MHTINGSTILCIWSKHDNIYNCIVMTVEIVYLAPAADQKYNRTPRYKFKYCDTLHT